MVWQQLCGMQRLRGLQGLGALLAKHSAAWQAWQAAEAPETLPLPGLEELATPLQRVLLVRALRPERTLLAVERCVGAVLGPQFLLPVVPELGEVVSESKPRTPILYLTPQVRVAGGGGFCGVGVYFSGRPVL